MCRGGRGWCDRGALPYVGGPAPFRKPPTRRHQGGEPRGVGGEAPFGATIGARVRPRCWRRRLHGLPFAAPPFALGARTARRWLAYRRTAVPPLPTAAHDDKRLRLRGWLLHDSPVVRRICALLGFGHWGERAFGGCACCANCCAWETGDLYSAARVLARARIAQRPAVLLSPMKRELACVGCAVVLRASGM